MSPRWLPLLLGVALAAALAAGAQLNRAPQFLSAGSMSRFSLPEDTPVGAPVYRLQGTDPEGSPVRFSISGEHFTVDKNTGVVSLRRALDREVQDLLEVIISITDEGVDGSDPNTVSLRREIPVLDVNDNAPVFRDRPYSFSVSEATKVGARLFDKVLVSDADGGLNADITLACVSSGPEDTACKHFKVETEKIGEGQYRGMVTLQRPLDYEQRSAYTLQLRATDAASDPSKRLSSTARVAVQVTDVQDQPPVFLNAPYSATVPEGSPPGTVVATIRVRDGDMGDPRPVLLTLEDDELGYFALEVDEALASGGGARLVTTEIPIDREHRDLMLSGGIYTFKVRATELINNELPADWSVSEVTVVVTDVDDQFPEFNEDYFHINVSEDIAVDSPLPGLNMVVVDGDLGDNARYALSLRDVSNSEGLFSVHPTSGQGRTPVVVRVRNKRGLDFDVDDPTLRRIEFDVVVHAKGETGDEEEFGSARVVVDLQDANDHSPVFALPVYRARASEAAAPGTKVLDVTATDRDSGDLGRVTYSLKGFGAERFRTHPEQGGVYVRQPLDYETERSYSLSLEARDGGPGGGRVTTVNVFVDVLDENDNAPSFEQQDYQRTVREGATSFQPAMFLRATDVDGPTQGGGHVTYSVTASNADGVLAVDAATGEVRMARPVSASHTPRGQYELTVRATDQGRPRQLSADAQLTVRVGVPGNQRPVFKGTGHEYQYHAAVREDAPAHTEVLQVTASDPDGQDSLIAYSIAAGTGAKDNFNIDGKSGVITVAPEARLDPDETGLSRYSLVVLAVDSGLPVRETASATVLVTIKDVNNKPPVFDTSDPAAFTRHVSERAQPGQAVLVARAKDPDEDAKLEYSIVEPIRAMDRTGVPLPAKAAYDYKQAFRIDPSTGEITVNGPLDHQSAAVITLTVQARDLHAREDVKNAKAQVARAEVTVYVEEYSDGNPLFTAPGWTPGNPVIKVSVPEEQPRGTVLAMLTAQDPADGGRAIRRFQVAAEADGTVPDWASVSHSGNVILERRLDFETLAEDADGDKVVALRVQAVSEDQRRTGTATIQVQVLDANDHTPQFAQPSYHTSVLESTRYPAHILAVSATDGDAPGSARGFGEVRYSLSGENARSFVVDPLSGSIQVAPNATLDREKQVQMKLLVVAADTPGGGGATQRRSQVPVTVDVLDVNDNAPVFGKRAYSTVIPENMAVGSGVLTVAASDPDEGAGAEVTYELVDQGEANGLFSIDAASGELRIATPLTGKGRREPYALTVRAQDNGNPPLSADVSVSVHIGDVVSNDGVPSFVHPALDEVAYVSENASVGSPVFRVVATDPDDPKTPEGTLVYRFLEDGKTGSDASHFSINPASGLISTRTPLDRETKAQFSLLLVAADRGPVPQQTTRLLTVHVTDVDDHKPVFKRAVDESPLVMTVQEELAVGSPVGNLTAVDEDVGENALIDYVITYGNEHDLFSVSRTPENGAVIRVARRLDREEAAEHLITVKCFKKSARPQSMRKPYNRQDPSERQVRVVVLDIDDNPPTFAKDKANLTLGVRLNVPVDTSLLTVEAEDADADSAPMRYWLAGATFHPLHGAALPLSPSPEQVQGVFRLDADTGELRTAAGMQQFVDGYFTLNVAATNIPEGNSSSSSSSRRANATVKVFVVRDRALLKFVFSKAPADVRRSLPEFQRLVEKALLLPVQLNVYDTQFYAKQDGSLDFSSTSSCFQLVGHENYDLSEMESLLMDKNNDELKSVYNRFHVRAVQRCAPALAKAEATWIQLWVLAIACFIGIASLIASCVVCCSYNRWERFR
ncbi:hypothetical protein ONE63_006768 [Megalurothrips usitatus]|uniref:Cadherin domain-containing protein n=1 Tax=Megalurothrips usitatus TaxID=439358 RepID=A0AAV7XR00_9NEOP|nr:hypothetical protein ONE63_006768 [Megalurothrips usitatus]